MKNLTNREKFLLKVLGIVLFITVFVFLIYKPQMEQLEANKLELQDTDFKVQDMEMTLTRYGKQDAIIKEKAEILDEKDDYILKTVTNEELEKIIMNIAEDNLLAVYHFEISDPEIAYFNNYPLESKNNETTNNISTYNLKEYYYFKNKLSDQITEVNTNSEVALVHNSITIVFTSEYFQYLDFLDDINNCNLSIYVKSTQKDPTDNNGHTKYHINLDLYSAQGKE